MNKKHKQTALIFLKTAVSRLYPFITLIVLGLLLYSNTYDSSFHLDDDRIITENPGIRNIHDLPALWNTYFLRIVGTYTFALNYHFNALNVFGYHVVNIAIHVIASFFVWWLMMLILSTPAMKNEAVSKHKELAALGCSLIFIAHPIQTQAITYIVQRYASLAALFYLASLCFFLSARLSTKRKNVAISFIASALAGIMGMFTKETVFTLPFVILFFEFGFLRVRPTPPSTKSIKTIPLTIGVMLFALIIPVILLFRPGSLFQSAISQRYNDPMLTSGVYLMTQFRVIATYIGLLLIPVNQNLDHDFAASQSFFEPATLSCFLILVGLFIFALWLFPKKRLTATGILWFFVTLSIESSLIPLGNVIFEHRLYLPMFGFGLIVVSIFHDLFHEKRAFTGIILFMTIISIYSLMTFDRNKVWKNELTLWSDVIEKSPEKARPYVALGNAYTSLGENDRAIAEFRKALTKNPNHYRAHYNLGNALNIRGDTKDAIREYELALKENPEFVKAHYNLGSILIRSGEYDRAIKELTIVLEMNPRHSRALYNYGNALSRQGEFAEAAEKYRQSLTIDPNYLEAYNNLGNTFLSRNMLEEAIIEYKKALKIKPDYAEAKRNLITALQRMGKSNEIRELLK